MSKKSKHTFEKRLPLRLPIIGPILVAPFDPHNMIIPYIALPNTPLARMALGEELIIIQEPDLIVCTNNYFVRYLQTTPSNHSNHKEISQLNWHKEMAVGTLILRLNENNQHIINNIYVDSAFRREGIATRLIERAYLDFPDICLDGRFSSFGLAFFGVKNRKFH